MAIVHTIATGRLSWVRGRALLALGLLAIASTAAIGATVPRAYVTAANAHDVPPVMLYALALTESGANLKIGRRPWPWTLNVHGTPRRYVSRTAACRALHQALNQTHMVDVGLGQLNVRWQQQLFGPGQRFAAPCAALNPYANLDAAAGVLARCHARHANSWIAAAGCYHRPAGGAPAMRYKRAFRGQLARLRPRSGHRVARSTVTASSTPGRHIVQTTRLTWIDPTPAQRGDRRGLD